MATIKSYTDLEQSKKLAEILPLESADMYYWADMHYWLTWSGGVSEEKRNTPKVGTPNKDAIKTYWCPCWSLASLLEQLPYELCDDDGNSSYLQMNKEDDVYQLVYTDPHGDFESIETDRYEHFVDACYTLILKLHELNLL